MTNPLCGKDGAAKVYGAQKGANQDMIKILDRNLFHFAQVIKRDLGKDVLNLKGGGAAGGLGAGLYAFLNARIEKGIELIMKVTKFKKYLKESDLVITGEGKIGGQVKYGKVILGVARLAKRYKVPVIALCGNLTDEAYSLHKYGITFLDSVIPYPIGLENSLKNTKKFVERKVEEISYLIKTFISQ